MPRVVTPDAVSGSVSPVAPSSRMPAALYLSIRVWSTCTTRAVVASGTLVPAVTDATA